MPDEISRNISVDTLVAATDVGAVDDTWVDIGDVIDMRQANRLIIYCDLVVNDSTGVFLRALPVKTAAGTPYTALSTASDTWDLRSADASHWVQFIADMFPFIQLQSKATVVGATEGTLAIDITKVKV